MNLRRNLVVATLCTSFMVGLVGCKNNRNENEKNALTIHIKDYEDKIIPRTDVISKVDTVELSTGSNFMGDINTICATDSVVYLLDRANAVWAFRYPSGDLVKRIQKMGHGNGEYVSARTITYEDGLLYLMDSDTRTILIYDSELNYKSSFHYGFPALDFIKVQDGFLFLNLIATDNLHRIVHTNDKGEVQQSYLPSEMSLDMIFNEKAFVRDKDGKVYIFPPFSNEVYRWTSEGPVLAFQTDFGKNNPKENVKSSYEITESQRAFNTNFFIVGQYLVNNFFYLGKNYYAFYNLKNNSQYQGVVDTTAAIPFVPRWQSDKSLIGFMPTADSKKWKPQKDSCDAALFVFHLK